ncbi:MAG: alpha/beta hydrolase, partial [Actinophytocola sp.]
MPMWPALAAMAHTLVYDAWITGEDQGLPASLAEVDVPVLGVYSTGSPSWLVASTEAVAKAVPDGDVVGLDGGFHEVPAATLAPVLAEFYRRRR